MTDIATKRYTSWEELSNCIDSDPNIFFPEKDESEEAAKKICQGCVVRKDCLDFALANDIDHGVWGGVGHVARRKIKRKQKQAMAS